MQCVWHGADADGGGDRGAGAECVGAGGGDAGFEAGYGGVEAEGFEEDGVEEGEGVDCFGGGE